MGSTSSSFQRAGLFVVLFACATCGGGCAQFIADRFLVPPRFEKRHAALAERREAYEKKLGDRLKVVKCKSFDGTKIVALVMMPKPPKEAGEAQTAGAQMTGAVAPAAPVATVEPAGVVFILHGLTDRKEAMLDIGESLVNAGYIAVLPDLRAHGESGGKYTTLGFWERRDLVACADYLGREGYPVSKFGVMGGSLGAAVAIQWAAIDPRIKAVVAVAPFAELRSELNHLYTKYEIGKLKQAIVESAAQEAGRFRIPDVSPLKSISQIDTPIYLAHGWNDDIVPASESRRLFHAAKGPVVLQTVDSNHVKIREALGRKFMKRSVEWMDLYVSGRKSECPPKWVAQFANRNFEAQAPVVVKENAGSEREREIATPAASFVSP
jgi:alpha-beta hydrolase superfamily lysophospholipase